jgi:hypothetical protein
VNGILHDLKGAGVTNMSGYAIRLDDILTERTLELSTGGDGKIDTLENIIKSIEENNIEPSDPPAVGDCPNEYAWNEH